MFTLVPVSFFNPDSARASLCEVSEIAPEAQVKYLEIPQYDAVLVYSTDEDSIDFIPIIADVLRRLSECSEYNKILCAIEDDYLYLAIAQGKSLLFANSFKIQDFTTAEYYIFLAVKSLQINPEISTICFLTSLSEEEQMSLYRYFKSVVEL